MKSKFCCLLHCRGLFPLLTYNYLTGLTAVRDGGWVVALRKFRPMIRANMLA